jgi:predicted CoA-substrate-specific enzyme activase
MNAPLFEGIEIGAVSVKWVQRDPERTLAFLSVRHEGKPIEKVREILEGGGGERERRIVITGAAAKSLLNLPYRSETECYERAVSYHRLSPDILVSLGGESFSVYPMKEGLIRNMISTSKCAAGTGEFVVQQFKRMDFPLEKGLQISRTGKTVTLATRCSVHCKSDATHKLNKGECEPQDIAKTLIHDLALKVHKMIEQAEWPKGEILIAGGVSLNPVFIEHLRDLMPQSVIHVVNESPFLEAFGAALLASDSHPGKPEHPSSGWEKVSPPRFETLKPLKASEALLDYRVKKWDRPESVPSGDYILGVDAGSTTTKAILLYPENGAIAAGSYLRTHGNPVAAVKSCLKELTDKCRGQKITLIQTAVTGSGREMVSVFLNNCLSFNEILAHARAASEAVGEVETVFEIGGQDSKYIAFIGGVPVDYAMNEGCSAGTGSFLEESASVDMGIEVQEISAAAEASDTPIAFGERCAAFINTDVRNAFQQGARKTDIVAGLVYSITDNYISRIVGPRHIGSLILFQGGVALNRSVGLAMAARTNRKIVVPPYPELMGCLGAALIARDHLADGDTEKRSDGLEDLLSGAMTVDGVFRCESCDNRCEIQKIKIHGRSYPFGGLCAKYENKRRHQNEIREGHDLIALRNRMMSAGLDDSPRPAFSGTIGLPMAISAYELYPYYATLINEMGYRVVHSEPNRVGNTKSRASICYPGEIAHGACYDLIHKHTDYIFLPYLLEMKVPDGYRHAYTCHTTTIIPDIIRRAFDGIEEKLLSPYIGFSDHLLQMTEKEIVKIGQRLGLTAETSLNAHKKAFAHYQAYKESSLSAIKKELSLIAHEPTIIIAGRPYTVCAPEVNLALPKKITSRGFHVISADMLPPCSPNPDHPKNVWRFTQQIMNAVHYVKQFPNFYICLLSCFSCGPDASIYHLVRNQLAGEVFCYLEIDSHTAHAGFETRVGAFLDIIEEKRRKDKKEAHGKE